MDRETVYEFGVQSGLLMKGQDFGFKFDEVMKLAELVAAHEREQCAKICFELDDQPGRVIAANIRDRGE